MKFLSNLNLFIFNFCIKSKAISQNRVIDVSRVKNIESIDGCKMRGKIYYSVGYAHAVVGKRVNVEEGERKSLVAISRFYRKHVFFRRFCVNLRRLSFLNRPNDFDPTRGSVDSVFVFSSRYRLRTSFYVNFEADYNFDSILCFIKNKFFHSISCNFCSNVCISSNLYRLFNISCRVITESGKFRRRRKASARPLCFNIFYIVNHFFFKSLSLFNTSFCFLSYANRLFVFSESMDSVLCLSGGPGLAQANVIFETNLIFFYPTIFFFYNKLYVSPICYILSYVSILFDFSLDNLDGFLDSDFCVGSKLINFMHFRRTCFLASNLSYFSHFV